MLALLSAVCTWVWVRHWSDGLHMGLDACTALGSLRMGLGAALVRRSAHGCAVCAGYSGKAAEMGEGAGVLGFVEYTPMRTP